MSRKVLHLPKWFPNKFDNQNGIFVDKHIRSVKEEYEQIVLSIFKDPSLKKGVQVNESKTSGITYVEVSFKPFGSKLIDVLFHGYLGLVYGYRYSKQVSIIHTHVMGRNVFIGWVISQLRHLKRIHTEHWSLFINPNQWEEKPFFYKWTTQFLLGQMQHILSVSEPLNKKLKAINPSIQSEVIGNVISKNPYSHIDKHEVFTFIHISDLRDDIKNITGVIQAFIQFEKEHKSPVQLLFIGDGPDRSKLESLADSHPAIAFLGRRSNDEVYQAMNQAHCLVLNSRLETFGMVVLEAFSCGIPVICAKNGVTEYFVDKSTGLVIEQENQTELVNAMKSMVLNRDHYLPSVLKEKAKPYSEVVIGNKIKCIYKTQINEK